MRNEDLLLAALNHQWQSTKKIAAQIPDPFITEHSRISKSFHYPRKLKDSGLVEE